MQKYVVEIELLRGAIFNALDAVSIRRQLSRVGLQFIVQLIVELICD